MNKPYFLKKIVFWGIIIILLAGSVFWFWQLKLSDGSILGLSISKNLLGVPTIAPDFFLDGSGKNIDSPEFFEATDPNDTLLLVNGKNNDTVEVWQFPFQGKELPRLRHGSRPNGLDIDQEKKLLLIGDAGKRTVEIFSLPNLTHLSTIGKGKIGKGETNLDTLTLPNGKKKIYVSENHKINIFDAETGNFISSFSPPVDSIEEVLADSFHQIIYIPEENGIISKTNQGGAISAHSPDGKPYLKNGSNIFGKKLFTGDEEGIALYRCLDISGQDNGRGVIIVANQSKAKENKFIFFDRITWEHLGSINLEGVSGTDGIAVSERPLPDYPQGLFAASNTDTNTAIVSWEKIAEKTGINCNNFPR